MPILYPTLYWRISTFSKELFLTFDDGPVPGPTEFVLDALRQVSVKATFFCIGDNVGKNSAIFRRIFSEGHQIGNHTFHHISGWKTNDNDYLQDVSLCDLEMEKIVSINEKAKLFRPPYGRISRSQIKALDDYKIVMWDVLSIDYSKRISKESCLKNTLNALRPGSIVVFHDSIKAERNLLYTLPRFLEDCLSKGYTFSKIPL